MGIEMKKFFKWIRFWYRRIRYGEFNEITVPKIGRPWPKIDAKTICETQPMDNDK